MLDVESSGKLYAGLATGYEAYSSATLEDLERDWRSLEHQADNSFFLSWSWMSCWLSVYQPACSVFRCYDERGLAGLALICESIERRRGFVQSRVMNLHQTGSSEKDQIWIEYNGLLSRRDCEEQVLAAFLEFCEQELREWEELSLSGLPLESRNWLIHSSACKTVGFYDSRCFEVDLNAAATGAGGYMAMLSSNTRSQIRRAERFYRQQGAIELIEANTVRDALCYFSEAGELHKEKWGEQSGFHNQYFVEFHQALIERCFPSRTVQLFKLNVADRPIAYFYFFTYEGVVYFYLSGLQLSTENRAKPGLLGHSMLIEHFCRDNWVRYDFMAGEERYKASLGEPSGTLCWLRIQRSSVKFLLEDGLILVKRALLG